MLSTTTLNRLGQSVWLDNITRELLDSRRLARYIADWSVTGLTSNPAIFDRAINHDASYDAEIGRYLSAGMSSEDIIFALAISDLSRAADLFFPIYERTASVDGWVSLELSPLLAHDVEGTVSSAKKIHAAAGKPNLFIKIPGTCEGLLAVEQAIFAGIPVNVTLLFSPDQYVAAAHAYMRGLERRIEAGMAPDVRSVASVFVSRWDRKVSDTVPGYLKNCLGLTIAHAIYKSYRDELDSDRWQRLANCGARAQRLLFASTSTKDPHASDLLYVDGLVAPNTVITVPEETLKALVDHGTPSDLVERRNDDGDLTIREFARQGINIELLGATLQADGTEAFVQNWRDVLRTIDLKSAALRQQAYTRVRGTA